MTKLTPKIDPEVIEAAAQTPQKLEKSFAKQVEDMKAEAAPAVEILGRRPEAANGIPTFNAYDFDPQAMVLDQSYLDGAQKITTLTCPVGKPGEQEWFRVHPDPDNSLPCVALLVEKSGDGLEKGHPYYVPPTLAKILFTDPNIAKHLVRHQLFLMVNSEGNPKFWKIKLPGPDGKRSTWATSEIAVAEEAKKRWVKRISNGSSGYNAGHPIGTSSLLKREPIWPCETFKELLGVAFRDFTIDNVDHPVLKRLRGDL